MEKIIYFRNLLIVFSTRSNNIRIFFFSTFRSVTNGAAQIYSLKGKQKQGTWKKKGGSTFTVGPKKKKNNPYLMVGALIFVIKLCALICILIMKYH